MLPISESSRNLLFLNILILVLSAVPSIINQVANGKRQVADAIIIPEKTLLKPCPSRRKLVDITYAHFCCC